MSDAVTCRGVCLRYGTVPVLTDLDLTVAPGEVVALLGPSGSGKTTLLHAIAGFVAPAGGEIQLGGRTVSTPRRCVPPERRRVGMVFQNYALWPHLTVLDTVAYPLRRRGVASAAARSRARQLLAAVGLTDLAGRRPAELSGGQQQRVGLARALAAQPQVFLFDEPTAHLDAHLRGVVLAEVAGQRAAAGAAALYATHDAGEALAVADRVAVLHGGRLAQVGTPEEVYARPADLTVARLTGPVSVLAAEPVSWASTWAGPVRRRSSAPVPGEWIIVRPDWAGLGGDLPGKVTAVRFAGPHTDYELATPGGDLLIRESGPPRVPVGSATTWTLRCSRPAVGHTHHEGSVKPS
jgi:ABC-type Fe3+/spermidine/putrescine transport system ATPase subunit